MLASDLGDLLRELVRQVRQLVFLSCEHRNLPTADRMFYSYRMRSYRSVERVANCQLPMHVWGGVGPRGPQARRERMLLECF